MKNSKLKGNIILFFAAFIWGTSFIAQSVGVETISPASFIGARSLLGGLVLLPVIFIIDFLKKKKNESVQKWNDKNLILGGIICGTVLFMASTLQTAGMVYTSPGKAGFITALYMIMVPIVNFFMGKKPSFMVIIAVLIAIVGMYLLCMDSNLSIGKGDILIFICAIFFTLHIMFIDHFSPKTDGVKLSCLQFFVSGIIATTWAIISDKPQIMPILNCWVSIGYSGIMSCGVAYTLQIIGQKYTDPTSASILMSLESVFSTLSTVVLVALGWQLTGGALSLREILGCIFMFAAIMLVQLPDLLQNRKESVNL